MSVKTAEEIRNIRIAAAVGREALIIAEKLMRPGTRANVIDEAVEQHLKERGATAANREVNGYAHASSISRWNEVAHAPPVATKILRNGDVVGVDIGVKFEGVYADVAETFAVGTLHPQVRSMMDACKSALTHGIHALTPNGLLSVYGRTVAEFAASHGISIMKGLTGHGTGRAYHEPPHVYNFYHPDNDIALVPGMVFAFELLVSTRDYPLTLARDGTTILTGDGNPSAHFEHTVLITESGPVILG
ncbi:MAG: type I methionyl aminopeptidase [Spirochaetota bacterium]